MCYDGDIDKKAVDSIDLANSASDTDTHEVVVGDIDRIVMWVTAKATSAPTTGTIAIEYGEKVGNMPTYITGKKATLQFVSGSPILFSTEIAATNYSLFQITKITNSSGKDLTDIELHVAGNPNI